MGVIIDEYGNISGLITLEDIIEEIVGDITDEHEKITEQIISIDQGGWIIDAAISLEKIEDLLNVKIESEDSVTLAGFMTEMLQHLPKKGERVTYKGFCFQVQQATSRRVYQVLVFEQKDEPTDSTSDESSEE